MKIKIIILMLSILLLLGLGAPSMWTQDQTFNNLTTEGNVYHKDTTFYIDATLVDTNFVYNDGSNLLIGGENDVKIDKNLYVMEHLILDGGDSRYLSMKGYRIYIDTDNDNANDEIYFSGGPTDAKDTLSYAVADYTLRFSGTFALSSKDYTVASTAELTLGRGNSFNVTGTADITSITAKQTGTTVTLMFSGTAATNGVVDGSNLKLNGDFGYTPDDILVLWCNGTNWYEVSRSAN